MKVMDNRILKRGQMFWADLGMNNKGSEQNGIRPVVIIQNDIGNKYSPTVIVSIISSQMQKAKLLPTHVLLSKEEYPCLKKDSFIALEQVRTIDKSRLLDYIGEVNGETFNSAIEISMGLKKINKKENYYEKVFKDKLEELKEIKIVIDYLKSKGKSIKMIEDAIKEFDEKLKELNKIKNMYNLNIEEHKSLNLEINFYDKKIECVC